MWRLRDIIFVFSICACNLFAFIQTCQTPNKEQGTCITLPTCPSLYDLIQKSILTEEDITFLKQSQCGYDQVANQPKVCCPIPAGSNNNNNNNNLLPDTDTCGIQTSDKLTGGELTNIEEFPWMALLEYQKPNGRSFHCGGSLINKNYIVTAAHCVTKLPRGWTVVSVRLGEHDLRTEIDCDDDTPGFRNCADKVLDIPVSETIIHEDYARNDPYENDIALLRISSDVTFTRYVTPICIPKDQTFLNNRYETLSMTIAGWGKTENASRSDVKLKLKVPIVSKAECSKVYSKYRVTLKDSQLCAGGVKGKDSCKGDSGGPLMTYNDNWYLAGVVSFGSIACGSENFPGIYTKVADYTDWILRNMKP